MTEPTTYEISLRGNVGSRTLRLLADDFSMAESEPGVTRLVGVVRDSSQMHGLVAHLASAGVEIISIVQIDFPTREEPMVTHETHSPRPHADGRTEEERVEAARRYVEQLQALYAHVAVFAAGMVVIFLVNLATNVAAGITRDWWAWWSVWAFLGWGSGIAIHGLVVRLNLDPPIDF